MNPRLPPVPSPPIAPGWGEELLARRCRHAEGAPAPGQPAPEATRPRSDSQWRAWQARLRRDTLAAAACYGVAHAVLGLNRVTNHTPVLTPQLLCGILLFLVGTALLWRVLGGLNEPLAARYPNAARTAGQYLALVMALAFTPCVWIFLVLN